jgi:nitroimidazol reductase NimA-like FMN-containing flavoprotein (pyridoxamine 5'-phosphate oxidase superfamily)
MTIHLTDAARKSVLAVLDAAADLTIATNRADGYPQATVVSFVSDGLKIYFGCSKGSQKARNLARDDRVSITVTPSYTSWSDIRGLSIGGRASKVENEIEKMKVGEMMLRRFPQIREVMEIGEPDDLAVFRIDPEVVTLLDYARGFGHIEFFDVAAMSAGAAGRARG